MKNLKRVLSLALATVMVIGMMVVGANAAFSDQADIKYDTAVDTLVALGVINGMGDNTFAPNGTVTRAQAAKMVAYVKACANETIIGYYTGTTKFTDVTAASTTAFPPASLPAAARRAMTPMVLSPALSCPRCCWSLWATRPRTRPLPRP